MESDNPDIAKNQALLQQEIIDRQLDQNEFIAFCQQKKENGDDLNEWSYEELSQVVSEFVSLHVKGTTENAPKLNLVEDEVKAENIEQGVEKIETGVPVSKKEKEYELKCRTLVKTEMNDKQVKVEVRNPRQETPGILKNSYTLYEVYSSPFNWTVYRRYSDFDWLRKALVKYFPGHYVPPLPHKKIGNRRLEDDFILKRMKYLNFFINSVLENENFKASEALLSFLSYTQRNQFEQKMKEYSSMQSISYVEDIKNINGKIVLSSDETNKKYFVNIEKYFHFQTQILKKVNYNIKCFIGNLREASNNLNCLSKNFELLYFLNNRVMMKEQITKTYEELQNFCDNWSKTFEKQIYAVQTHFKDFFKLLKLEGESFQELVNSRNEIENKYSSEFVRISLKKDKLFNTHDPSKFEISSQAPVYDANRIVTDKTYAFTLMCSKDNAMLDQIERFLQYYNKMSLTQLKTLVKSHCARFYKNFKDFDALYYPCINDGIMTWTNMETFLQTVNVAMKVNQK